MPAVTLRSGPRQIGLRDLAVGHQDGHHGVMEPNRAQQRPAVFKFARSATATVPVALPWLNVNTAFVIAVAQYAGNETAVALDYRTSAVDPRVVASEIWTVPGPGNWRVVAETF